MWDPRNYEDADFGLDEDESFEPNEYADPEIDTAIEAHIMTVLGPILPDDLGICLPVEYIFIDPPGAPEDLRLNDSLRSSEELTNLVTAGGKAIIDATTQSQGRDLVGLFDVARRVPIHILCSTSTEHGPERMIADIRDGVGPRKIRPGVIQAGSDPVSLDAARLVATTTGLPVFATMNEDMADLERLPSTSTVVLNCDNADERIISKIVEAGNRVAVVGIGTSDSDHEAELAKLLVSMAAAGFAGKLLISQRLDRRSQLHAWGGQPGLVYLLERFTLELMEAGAEATLVRQLLVENPMNALTIRPNVTT
jgi:phosphotriesterase-related protein